MLTDTAPEAADILSVLGAALPLSSFMSDRLDEISNKLVGMTNAEQFWFGIGAAFQALEPMIAAGASPECVANALRGLFLSYIEARSE